MADGKPQKEAVEVMLAAQSAATKIVQTETEFCTWLGSALPGDKCVYHTGFLMIDADRNTSMLAPRDRDVLVSLRDRVMEANELGLVRLVQRRLGVGRFEYVAVASVPKAKQTRNFNKDK